MPSLPFRLRSFRVRIALLSTALSGIVLIAFGLGAFTVVQRMSMHRIDETIRDIAQRHLGARQGPRHWDRVAESLQYLGGPEEDPYILHVKGRDGSTLFVSSAWPSELPLDRLPSPGELDWRRMPRPAPPPPPPMDRGRGFHDGRGGPPPLPVKAIRYYTAEASGQTWRVGVLASPEATMALGMNLSRYNAEVEQLRRTFLIVTPVALMLIALGGWWLAQRALRPVRRLTRLMEGVTAKGLDLRIPSSGEAAEFNRLTAVFNNMLDRLEISFRQAVRFSADAAHELKTPLTVLQGELEQNLQGSAPGAPEQQVFSQLLEEVQRLKSIVRKLLLLSMADSGQLRLHLEPLDLSAAVEAVCDDIEILAPHLALEKTIAPDLWVAADSDLLQQSIQNVVDNALKYTGSSGVVRLELMRTNDRLRLRVGNSGPGIPPEDRPRLFERFYRADRARNRRVDGAGLGLSLAREIARAHHGDLQLEASDDGWTSFVMELPATGGAAPNPWKD